MNITAYDCNQDQQDCDFSYRQDNVHYSLQWPRPGLFYIDSSTGAIMLKGALDRERRGGDKYNLVAMATDR